MNKSAAVFNNSTIEHCSLVTLNQEVSGMGHTTGVSTINGFPFPIERVYFLFDVPGGATRGGHAHYELYQYLIAASGSYDVVLDDGKNKKCVTLNRPDQALQIVPGIWRELENFSSGSACLVIASLKYSAADYIRDYDAFIQLKHHQSI